MTKRKKNRRVPRRIPVAPFEGPPTTKAQRQGYTTKRRGRPRPMHESKRTVEPAGYQEYINSDEWRAVRRRYWASKMPKDCYVCGASRHPGMHLHHRTYKNLGNEQLVDLVPVCEGCHEEIHMLQRENHCSLSRATKWARRRHHDTHAQIYAARCDTHEADISFGRWADAL
jgi:hypothetical protein